MRNEKLERINSAIYLLQLAINDLMIESVEMPKPPKFNEDRLTKTEAAKFVGVTMPTFDKLIKGGRFKQYNIGYRKLFLRSEIVEALKKSETYGNKSQSL